MVEERFFKRRVRDVLDELAVEHTSGSGVANGNTQAQPTC